MPRRILIVDDEQANRQLLVGLLGPLGHEIEIAADGLEALERIEVRQPDLLLLDIRMPRMDGLETLRRVRAHTDWRWFPIVLVTSASERDARLAGFHAGADEFLEKPIDRARMLEELTVLDECTSLYNSRFLSRVLPVEVERARRFSHQLSSLFVDLDHFKDVNDVHGHSAGTALLVEVAKVIKDTLRTVDIPIRYGGDEFVILLPETGKTAAIDVALRLRRRLARDEFHQSPRSAIHLTASIGLATFPEDADSEGDLLKAADDAMYLVKSGTRNAVAAAGLGVIADQ